MSTKFYESIIEEEKKAFKIKVEALQQAAKDVSKTYSREALLKGTTFLDYNIPPNRCAYLFKYGTVHTELVAKYFKKLIDTKEFKKMFDAKKEIRICSLGGGPGTDIVGIFKALAIFPSFHKKVVQVTVLDLVGGWRNSFKHVISRLKHGKVGGVPASFIDSNNFKADLIAVDLLKPLPENIRKIISNSDVISMVKFVSAVLGIQESLDALKVIGNTIKPEATIFFIDNFSLKVFEPLEDVSKECGFTLTLGPLHEKYIKSSQKAKKPKNNTYGCPSLNVTRIYAIGWIKTSENLLHSEHIPAISTSTINDNEEDSWDTESDTDDSSVQLETKETNSFFGKCKPQEATAVVRLDKFTQTYNKCFSTHTAESNIDQPFPNEMTELFGLIDSISDLLNVMKKLEQKSSNTNCCCKC